MNTQVAEYGGKESAQLEPLSTSRRAAIKMGLAALAGVGISALAPSAAFAASGGDFILGQANDAQGDETSLTSTTGIYTLAILNTNSTNGSCLECLQSGGTAAAVYVQHTGSGTALAVSNSGTGKGVTAASANANNNNDMVSGSTSGNDARAVAGYSASLYPNARGLYGTLSNASAAGCAIEGTAHGSSMATGVWGNIGSGGNGYGVKASNAGTGGALKAEITAPSNPSPSVYAVTNGAGYAVEAHGANGLLVDGVVALSRSGVVSVSKNKSYVTVSVPSGVAASAYYLATFQSNAGPGVAVAYTIRTGATTFRAYFTKKTTKAAKMGWIVLH